MLFRYRHKIHGTAMELLQRGVDQSVITLWLKHERVETTQIYLHADMQLKEKALARALAPDIKAGRYLPDDRLLAFLETLRMYGRWVVEIRNYNLGQLPPYFIRCLRWTAF